MTANTATYVYVDPLSNGYKRFFLAKKQHNELFKYDQLHWFTRYEYYISDDRIIVNRFTHPVAIAINLILFPLSLLLHGMVNFKESWTDHKKLLNEKKHGSFLSEIVWARTNTYKKIAEIVVLQEFQLKNK